jgi:hypothetical protein
MIDIMVPPDFKRDARAKALAPFVGTWPLYTLRVAWGAFPAGTVFRRAPSSKDDGSRYRVNSVACECPDYQERGNVCKHVRAHRLWERRETTPAPRTTYADLFPACRVCGDLTDDARHRLCDRCAAGREWLARRVAVGVR